jgi:Sigma-70 region 2
MGFMVRMRSTVEVEPTSEGFSEFFERTYARLASACLLLTGSPAEAEDLAQEALSRLREVGCLVRSMTSPKDYLFRTALNLNRKAAQASRGPSPPRRRLGGQPRRDRGGGEASGRLARRGGAAARAARARPGRRSRTLTALGK